MKHCLAFFKSHLYTISTVSVLFLCVSCSTLSPHKPIASLEERAAEFAEILNRHDLDAQYYFMSPSYRETYSIEHFKTRKRAVYSNVSFHSIDRKNDAYAIVYFTADMQLIGFDFKQTRIYFPFELTPDGWFVHFIDAKKPDFQTQ